MKCVAPAHATGWVSVDVGINGQDYDALPRQLLYIAEPTVTAVDPVYVDHKNSITVSVAGTNFFKSPFFQMQGWLHLN